MFLALTLAGLTLSAVPAAATQGPTAAPTPGEARVCKYAIKTGTRFKEKKCRTRAEWDAISESARQTMKDTVDRPQHEIPINLPPDQQPYGPR